MKSLIEDGWDERAYGEERLLSRGKPKKKNISLNFFIYLLTRKIFPTGGTNCAVILQLYPNHVVALNKSNRVLISFLFWLTVNQNTQLFSAVDFTATISPYFPTVLFVF